MVVNETTASEVNHFDFTSAVRFNQDVFWFQIAVDQFESVDVTERRQNLFRYYLETRNSKVCFLLLFTIVL